MSDFAQMEQKFDPKGGLVEFGDDKRLFVEFSSRPVVDPIASKIAGRPVHVQVDYVRIQQPGERDCILRPAHDGDRRRFRNHWAAYQDGRQNVPDGTQLSVLFPNNPEIVENLKYDKVFTVEQLAGLSDTQKQNIGMGALAWSQKAQAFLDTAAKGAGYHDLASKVDQMAAERAADKDRIAALEAALAEKSEERRGPGRPPKAAVAA